MASTSGRIHSEFVRLLFLQAHGETDRFFTASGVQLPQPTTDQFHFLRVAFSCHLKAKIDNILAETTALRITLNRDGTPIRHDHTLTHHTRKPLVY